MKNINGLYLPAITGQFANWRYYQVVMKAGDIVKNLGNGKDPNYRIKTVTEVEVIYSRKGVNNLLQRAFDPKRLNPIKKYLLEQPDKYINNLTVAIFEGDPEWLPVDLRNMAGIDIKDEDYFEELGKTFGIIHLTGSETLFVLDGQHRLKGLRAASKESNELTNEEIAITLITHVDTPKGIKRTRRLFATINRHAKPVSEGENILLDEDDVSAIIVRRLIEEYKLFRGRNVIAQNKTANLKKSDVRKFSTVISLWNVNEILIDHSKLYPIKLSKTKYLKVRPVNEGFIDEEKEKVFRYWNTFFELFPKAKKFILEHENSKKDYRSNGGPFYLRPIGQEVIAIVYKTLSNSTHKSKIHNLSKIEVQLKSSFWNYVLWNPYKGTMINNKTYASNYLLYHFGFPLQSKQLSNLKENYKKNSGEQELDLPSPKHSSFS